MADGPTRAEVRPSPPPTADQLLTEWAVRQQINKPNIDSPGTLMRFERAAVAMRLIELQADPVKPTFDVAHLREINRRLFQDVYSNAGEFSSREQAKWNTAQNAQPHSLTWPEQIRSNLRSITESVVPIGQIRPKEEFVASITNSFRVLSEWKPFQRGNTVTAHVFLSQMAEAAGYDLDFTRVDASRWNAAYRSLRPEPGLDFRPVPGSEVPLRTLVRELSRPLRAGAFAHAIRDGDEHSAIAKHPELKPVFRSLDEAIRRLPESGSQARNLSYGRRRSQLIDKVQRSLDEGLDPQKLWQSHIERLLKDTARDR